MEFRIGGSLIGAMLTTKLSFTLYWPSLATIVISAIPYQFDDAFIFIVLSGYIVT